MNELITIPAADAVAIASLATFTANPKDGTPVLAEIEVTVTGAQLVALATDRFTAGEYKAELPGTWQLDPVTFRLSATAAKFISTNVKKLNKWRDADPVEFMVNINTREVTITYGNATITDTWNGAKFPRVETLFDGWQPATETKPVKLRSAFLARLGKLVDQFSKVDYWVLELGAPKSELEREKGRPGIVLATAGNYRVIIQPNNYNTEDKI